jgi:DNA uptake protein ComE-like DNA-binding protein
MTTSASRVMTLLAALLTLRAALDTPYARVEPPHRRPPAAGAARLLYGQRLDPNREPAEVLALLPGIGPARAAAIVAARPHCSLADVDRTPGVGPATLLVLSEWLTFRDPPPNC